MAKSKIGSFGIGILGVALFGVAVGVPWIAHADIIALQLPNVPGDERFAAANGLPADSIRVLTVGNSVGVDCSSGRCERPEFSNVSVTKKFGESSAPLFLTAATGKPLPTATISFYRMKQGVAVRYYTITLQNVTITSQAWVGNSNEVGSTDVEDLELQYSRITLFDNETGSRACFDVQGGQTC
jgi:type VI secretion system Hcp family effector